MLARVSGRRSNWRNLADAKLTAGLEEYAEAWKLLGERERLCFDLVMFAGMRESEVFGLWCGDVREDGIQIERSWYKGRYEAPKTPKSERTVGVPDEILTQAVQVGSNASGSNGPGDCVFPSAKLVTPIWPESVLRDYVRPKLRPVELGWINFAVLRRSHSTLHKQTELGPQDHRRPTGAWNAHAPGQIRPERSRGKEGGSAKAVR